MVRHIMARLRARRAEGATGGDGNVGGISIGEDGEPIVMDEENCPVSAVTMIAQGFWRAC